MAPIRLGVIGLSSRGWASTNLIPPIFHPLLADKYALTALCTTSEASAKAAVAKYSELAKRPVKGYFGKNGQVELANDPNVDLLVVSVKVPHHYDALLPAIEAGKDIFVEWAPGKDLEETIRIAEAAKAKGIRALVGAQGIQGVAVNKAKEIIESGKIGKVLSTSVTAATSLFGNTAVPSSAYSVDINNGATLLSIPIGHFLVVLSHVLGDLSEVSAIATVRNPEVALLDAETGKPTGEILKKTTHDQIALSGILKGAHEGALVNIHQKGGVSRVQFSWTIDGEKGSIVVRPTPERVQSDAFISIHDKEVLLNGEVVPLDFTEVDTGLGNTGKAWLEFAKGKEGRYETLEHAVEVHRILNAASRSISEGRKISLV